MLRTLVFCALAATAVFSSGFGCMGDCHGRHHNRGCHHTCDPQPAPTPSPTTITTTPTTGTGTTTTPTTRTGN